MDADTLAALDALESTIQSNPDQARALLDTLAPAIPSLELEPTIRLARLAGDLAAPEIAAATLQRALELDPGCRSALRGLAELRRAQGDCERALELLSRLADQGDPEGAVLRVELLAEAGRTVEAERAASDLAPRLSEPLLSRLARLAASLGRGTGDGEEDGGEAPAARAGQGPPRAATDAELVALTDLFAGREGVHARQWKGPDGRSGYSPAHQPLTPALVRQHLLGALTLGSYLVRRDGTCGFLVLDVDLTKAALADLGRGGRRAYEDALGRTLAHALSLGRALQGLGLEPVLEESGHKGHHAWVFFQEPWPASRARELSRAIAALAGGPSEGLAVDVFPAQARVPANGFGNLVKLPLGLHQKTGRWSRLLDGQGLPHADPLAALARAPRAGHGALEAALAHARAALAARLAGPGTDDEGRNEHEGDEPERPTRPARCCRDQAEPQLPAYDPEADPELGFLRERCTALREIVRLSRAGRPLTHDEQAVLTFTVGHLTHGPEAVNALVPAAELGGERQPLQSRLRGQPMGCRKIRARLGIQPHDEGCDCRFDPTLGQYPNPLLHLAALRADQEAARREVLAAGAEGALAASAESRTDSPPAAEATGTTEAAIPAARVIPFPGPGLRGGSSGGRG